MRDYLITKNALKLLARIVLSCCHPLMNLKQNSQHQKYLSFRAKEGVDISLSSLSKPITENFVLYDKLVKMADALNKEKIDQEVVINYFGTKVHLDKVLESMVDQRAREVLSELDYQTFLFLHMLLPGNILRFENNRIDVVFQKRDIKIIVRNLVSFQEDRGKIEEGQPVLFHFAAVISTDCDKIMKQHLISEEAKSREFLEAARFFNGKKINLEKLASETEKLFQYYEM